MENEKLGSITTGYSRGYVRVAERFVEKTISIETALKAKKNTNLYKSVKHLVGLGAKNVTVCSNQHAQSSQYMYFIFTGYAK